MLHSFAKLNYVANSHLGGVMRYNKLLSPSQAGYWAIAAALSMIITAFTQTPAPSSQLDGTRGDIFLVYFASYNIDFARMAGILWPTMQAYQESARTHHTIITLSPSHTGLFSFLSHQLYAAVTLFPHLVHTCDSVWVQRRWGLRAPWPYSCHFVVAVSW